MFKCVCQLEDAVSLAAGVVALGECAGESLPQAHLAIGLCRSMQATDGKPVYPSLNLQNEPGLRLSSAALCSLSHVCGDSLFNCAFAATLKADRDEFNRRALQSLRKYA